MPPPVTTLPDALVLSVGGVVGEAWHSGVLAGIEDEAGIDFREVEYMVGTSAGSIVAATLAAGHRPRRPDEADRDGLPSEDELPTEPGAAEALARGALRWSVALSGPVIVRAAPFAAPSRALTRAAMLAALAPRGEQTLDGLHRQIDKLGVRFDGRLRVCVSDRKSGRRTVLGAPGAPRASVADAVTASCSIPGRFKPFAIGGREYVDGGAWSPTNLDIVPVGADAEVLCLHATGTLTGGLTSMAGPIVALARAAAGVEALGLRRKGANVRVVNPDQRAAEKMGDDYMDPDRRSVALAAGYAQGRALARGDGSDETA
jgi:NTE family protein